MNMFVDEVVVLLATVEFLTGYIGYFIDAACQLWLSCKYHNQY